MSHRTPTRSTNNWPSGLTGTNAVLLGALLGLMMCFDMRGAAAPNPPPGRPRAPAPPQPHTDHQRR